MSEMSGRALNMLLLLSSSQSPEPEDEVLEIEDVYSDAEEVPFAVSRLPVNLTDGTSLVTFYGDEALNHRLLAQGTFRGFVSSESEDAKRVVKASQIYDYDRLPETFRGFVFLSNYKLLDEVSIDSLDGLLSDDQVLTEDYLYSHEAINEVEIGKRKNSLYYIRGTRSPLSIEERTLLLRSEVATLQDKCHQLGEKYRDRSNRAERLIMEKEQLESERAKVTVNRSPREKILERMGELTKRSFSNLEFYGDSLMILAVHCSHTPGTWDLLNQLNSDLNMPTRYDWEKFEGRKGIVEIKLSDPQRVYFKRLSNQKTRVLVSLKKLQGRDKQSLKDW
jgi:hypothetical protein